MHHALLDRGVTRLPAEDHNGLPMSRFFTPEPLPDQLSRQCRKQMQTFFDAGVQEIRLVFNEPNKDAYLKALKAVAPRG